MKTAHLVFGAFLISALGCGSKLPSSGTSSQTAPTSTASEVAATVASSSASSGDTTVAYSGPMPREGHRGLELIPRAYADNTWTCNLPTITEGGSSETTYQGAGTYLYTPGSCDIVYGNGATATSTWSGSWTMVYNSSCTVTGAAADFKIGKQPSNCTLTKTSSGITRSLTGPDGNIYAINHSTNGAGTGYNTNISPSNTGVQFECTAGSGPCTAGTITVNGSHLTGSYNGLTFWNHTVTTGTPLSLTVTSSTKTITSGTLVVQHNLLQTTSTSTFSNVVYSKADCCFPVSGTITTTYSGGSLNGKTETLTFDGSSCGIGTVTKTDGSTATLQLIHCI